MDANDTVRNAVTGPGTAGMTTGDTGRLRALCTCAACPSYTECMREKGELLYCVFGKSPACIFEKRGCICPVCPVKAELRLHRAYYCIRGTEAEQLAAAGKK